MLTQLSQKGWQTKSLRVTDANNPFRLEQQHDEQPNSYPKQSAADRIGIMKSNAEQRVKQAFYIQQIAFKY